LFYETNLNVEKTFTKQEIVFIRKSQNRGFAAANNVAVKFLYDNKIHFDYLWLLNNDTIVDNTSLTHLINFTNKANDDIGIVGSKLLFYNNPLFIQAVGGKYNPWLGRVKEIGLGERDLGQFDNKPINFDYVVGASMFVRKKFIDSVGLMDEDLFIYFEELDWSIRAKKLGFKMGFCSASKVFHKVGASINAQNKRSLLADFYFLRNRILITKKYFPNVIITLYPILILSILNKLRKGEFYKLRFLLYPLINSKKKLSAYV
ncbi:MAG: glycosyltransferase family 2 protein, partial [Cyclobacteriaceae bacterium]|nr:glycosyltransferase family 2 protein [Cyclobacteriaceae bacterium]